MRSMNRARPVVFALVSVVAFVVGVAYSVVVTVSFAHTMGITGFDVFLAFEYVQRTLLLTDFASVLPAVAAIAVSGVFGIMAISSRG